MEGNIANIVSLLERDRSHTLLDVGCDDGSLTMRLATAVGTTLVKGVEVVEERAVIARSRGIAVSTADLNLALPYGDSTFDVVTSNQVIEHLADTDRFVEEIWRVVKPGGYVVTSTENLASWHNIGSLVLGWQPFSLTNVTSTRMGLGNPLAVHRQASWEHGDTWQHRRVFAFRGLKELFEAHGFSVETIKGSGYYPLPSRLASFDPRHAAFLAVKTRKST
jgi:2-polyprenyl-3-methyl-5-hydroxy-6-metoxy-1,4-benzoquinol methylase